MPYAVHNRYRTLIRMSLDQAALLMPSSRMRRAVVTSHSKCQSQAVNVRSHSDLLIAV